MFVLKLIVFLLPVLWGASCVAAVQHTDRLIASGYGRPWIPTTPEESKRTNIQLQIQKFEEDVNASRVLQKNDRDQMVNWADEFQIKRLDVTMRYRMQMIRHQEHSLKSNGNPKWLECLFVHRKEIRRSIHLYYESEHLCLKAATSKDEESKEPAEQLDKQIVKWRKGYRYLVNLCRDEHPTSKQQEQECLVEYMQNDKYNEVIRRLMLLKQTATSDLYAYYNSSLIDLEECLKTNLSRYLDRIRNIMETLNKCYTITT
ncbi:uncharacterized protein LOC124634363 isoform X1 [Helicoverpa zea]|uniref:uncharacterized protein LOC124634363 isoform X1 n=1 Tax=Helicoverpa zea TaxID=7113 RepID=UPI001F57AC29|nr:uncharacterized protein LOC124634363 isoform X1 [Helicoverpa zea]